MQFLSSTLLQTLIRDCILKRHQAISKLMHGFKTFSQMCCIMLRDKQRHVPPAHLGFKKHFSRYVLPSGPSWGFWNAEPSQHHRSILLSSAQLASSIVHLPSRPAPQRPRRATNTNHIPQSDDVPVPDPDRSWTIRLAVGRVTVPGHREQGESEREKWSA